MKTPFAAAFGLFLCTAIAPAAITWSGFVGDDTTGDGVGDGILIPTNFAGVYLDLEDGGETPSTPYTDPGTEGSYTVGYNQPASWDVNFFFNGIGIAYNETFQPARVGAHDDVPDALSRILNVEKDVTEVNDSLIDYLGVGAYGGSGQSNGSAVGESHFGAASDYFQSAEVGYIAFVLNPDNPTEKRYGWMEVTLVNGNTVPGTIHQWAYSADPIIVGAIPEPGSIALLLAGSAVMLRRRRS